MAGIFARIVALIGATTILWRRLLQGAVSIFWFRSTQFWGTYQGYRHSSPITQQLRQTFYYPDSTNAAEESPHEVEPIRYDQAG